MKLLVNKFLKDTNGATAIEYALIASLISIAIIGGVTALSTNSTITFETINDAM